jgi:hypothetical protein
MRIILWPDFRHLHHGAALRDPQQGVRQAGIRHLDRGLVIDPQKDTGCQQNLDPAILSRDRLASRKPGGSDGLFAKRLAAPSWPALPCSLIVPGCGGIAPHAGAHISEPGTSH